MNDRDMILSWLLDDSVSDERMKAIEQALDRDPQMKKDAGEMVCIQRMVRHVAYLEREAPDLVKGVLARLKIGKDQEEELVAKVEDRLSSTEGTSSSDKRLLRGEFWRTGWLWRVAATAASLLLVAGVWWALVGRTMIGGADRKIAQIECGQGQKAVLKFDSEETVLEMAENTVLRLPNCELTAGMVKSGPRKVVEVVNGSVNVVVARQNEGRTFTVKSQQMELSVIGTKFVVDVNSAMKRTKVAVEEGVVRMRGTSGDAAVNLVSGVTATAAEGKPIELSGTAVRLVRAFGLPRDIDGTTALACDGDLAWISQTWPVVLFEINPDTREVKRQIDLRKICVSVGSMAYGDDAVWAVAGTTNRMTRLLRVDTTDSTVREVAVTGVELSKHSVVTYGGGSVWVGNLDESDGSVVRVDPATGRALSRISVGARRTLDRLVWFDDGLWILVMNDSLLVRIDPASGRELVKVPLPLRGRGWWMPAGGEGRRFLTLNIQDRGGLIFDATFAGQETSKQSPVSGDR